MAVKPIKKKMGIMYFMKRNFVSSRTSRKLSAVKMLSVQFAIVPQFIPTSRKESEITQQDSSA
jgi:hypothetical protein